MSNNIDEQIESYLKEKEYEAEYSRLLTAPNENKLLEEKGKKEGCKAYLDAHGRVVEEYTFDDGDSFMIIN